MPETDQIKDEAEIRELIGGMTTARQRGDANAF
jgi:hypothetical protein